MYCKPKYPNAILCRCKPLIKKYLNSIRTEFIRKKGNVLS